MLFQYFVRMSDSKGNSYHQVIITLGKECKKWCDERANLEIRHMIDSQGGDGDAVVYTNSSLMQG